MLVVDSAVIRQAMLNKAVGIMELAKLAKMSPRTISLVYRHDMSVAFSTVTKLAKALDISPQSIVKGAI